MVHKSTLLRSQILEAFPTLFAYMCACFNALQASRATSLL